MIWEKLKTNHCPQCSAKIYRSGIENYKCLECGFYCRYGKAEQIIFSLEQRKLDKITNYFLKQHSYDKKRNSRPD